MHFIRFLQLSHARKRTRTLERTQSANGIQRLIESTVCCVCVCEYVAAVSFLWAAREKGTVSCNIKRRPKDGASCKPFAVCTAFGAAIFNHHHPVPPLVGTLWVPPRLDERKKKSKITSSSSCSPPKKKNKKRSENFPPKKSVCARTERNQN